MLFLLGIQIVTKWLSKEEDRPQWYKNRVNAGIHDLNKKVLNGINELPSLENA